MTPYNHDAKNIIDACGFTREEVEEFTQYSTPTLILEKCPKRFLALQVQAAVKTSDNKALNFVCQSSKLKKLQIPRTVNKHVHPRLHELVKENAEDLLETITKNIVLYSFATWHYQVIFTLDILYDKKSKSVEYIENIYTKEELLLVLAYAFLIKKKALATKMLLRDQRLFEKSGEEITSKLKEIITNELDLIRFDGKEFTDEELEITPYDDEKINREIDQNLPKDQWLKSSNIYNLYGIHTDCAKTTEGTNLIESLDMLYNSRDYTELEIACQLENLLWNIQRHNVEEFGEDNTFVKCLIEFVGNKLNWKHQFAIHDRVGRVLLLKENKATREDILYIMQEVF